MLIVVGSEGKGLSRLVTENCDAVVSIPINWNRVAQRGHRGERDLYQISTLRAAK